MSNSELRLIIDSDLNRIYIHLDQGLGHFNWSNRYIEGYGRTKPFV